MSEYVDQIELLRWERRFADLAAAALRRYLPLAADAVLPSLTADALGPIPPAPDQIATTVEDWEAILRDAVLPEVESLMAERVLSLAAAAGITVQAGDSEGAPVERQPDAPEPRVTLTPNAPDLPPVSAIYGTTSDTLERAYAIPTVREWMETYLASVNNRMVRTPDTVFRLVASALDEGTAAGEGIVDLRERVEGVLDYSGTNEWPRRAELVARTEATGAFNASTLEAARVEQEAFGIELHKAWVCTIDRRTRDSHFAADGQRVALDATFKVGDADLRFPGDPEGPVSETGNCRCTMITLEPDEGLPTEDDRQTERGPTNSTVASRQGQSRQDEIDRRAEDGVTRARDEDDGSLRAAAIGDTMKRKWTGRLAPIGEVSGDRRIFKKGGAYEFRTFPLPLMYQRQTSMGHDEAVTIGSIRSAEVRDDGIYAEGVLFDNYEVFEAMDSLREGVTRPSIDWCDETWEIADQDGNPIAPDALSEDNIDTALYQITGATIMAATLVSKPAFDGTYVEVDEETEIVEDENGDEVEVDTEQRVDVEVEETALAAALTASSFTPPVFEAAAFRNPNLDKVTGIHATPDGRVVGHIATWNECHMGVKDRCVMAPRSKTGYALFHVSEVETDEGPVAVGRLTVGAGHAHPKLGVIPAQEHYDNAAACWAIGRAYEDDFGIAFAGVVHPDATPRQIMDGTSAPLSGDWRRHGGNLELVAALTVNTPGYPVLRGAADARGRDFSLVAAGVVPLETHEEERPLSEIVAEAARAAVAEYAALQRLQERAAAVVGRVGERIAEDNKARAARLAARREEVLA